MDQEKIGKFIQKLRKEKELTQQELANKLNVTDRAVSKWETGRGLPDLSIIKPLCEELDISINELLSGEKLNKKEYNEKLEENIEKTIEYTNDKIKNIKNKINITLIVIGTIISLVLLDTAQALLFKNSPLIGIRDEYLSDADSYVDKGILVNTYYCVKEKDIVEVKVLFKTTKFDCPIDKADMCPPWPNIVPTMNFEESKRMKMTIKEGTLNKDGVTVIIKDLSGERQTFGEEYRVDVYKNGVWEESEIVLEDNYAWNAIGYSTDENGYEMKIQWTWLYGKLEPGHYRIVKSIMPKMHLYEYFSVEFDIK